MSKLGIRLGTGGALFPSPRHVIRGLVGSGFMKDFFKEVSIGYANHIWLTLLTVFFIIVAKKIELQIDLFGVIYCYVACLLVGHYSAHNIKPTKKYKYIKGKNDTFAALPAVGAVNMLTYGIPILILDHFFKIL